MTYKATLLYSIIILQAILPANAFCQNRNGNSTPNVVFILADDLGWRDVGYMGSKYYKTPNIDALANEGIIFTNAYAPSPLCTASRGSLITGLYPSKTGIIDASGDAKDVRLYASVSESAAPRNKALPVQSATRLKLDYYTLAEAFKDAGYTTAHFGKWHLGFEPYDPLHHGFEIDIPHTNTSGPQPNGWFAPWPVWPGKGKTGENLEDAIAREAAHFIKANRKKSFFLNYWSYSVHAPWDAEKRLIDKYAATANPNDPQHNPVYAAMIEVFDNAVGTIVKSLKEEGVYDNTVIVFYSDNGGVNWGENKFIPDPYKGVPITSNAPLKAGKATTHNGGVRVPAFFTFPNFIKAGIIDSTSVISGIDIYPTLLQLCNIKQKPGIDLDGVSLMPALNNKPFQRGPIFFHFPLYIPHTGQIPATAVIDGDWKLVRNYFDNEDQTDRFELFNLKNDVGETLNLAERNPQKVQELNKQIAKFLNQGGAIIPRLNTAYRAYSLNTEAK